MYNEILNEFNLFFLFFLKHLILFYKLSKNDKSLII